MEKSVNDETLDETVETAAASAAPASAAAPGRTEEPATDLTRLVSATESGFIRRHRISEVMRPKKLLAAVVLLLGGLVAALAAGGFFAYEDSLTWPGETTGAYDDVKKVFRLDDDTSFVLYWPNTAGMTVDGDGTNRIEVMTAIGRDKNVPFHLLAAVCTVSNGYHTTTAASYAAWKDRMVKAGYALDFTEETMVFPNDAENGFPMWRIPFRRNIGQKNAAGGNILYFRHFDKEVTLVKEVPLGEMLRARRLMRSFNCIGVGLKRVRRHVEIPEKRVDGNLSEMLSYCFTRLSENPEGVDWVETFAMIRTVIVSAAEDGDKQLLTNALHLLDNFRVVQNVWYVRKCLEYQQTTGREAGAVRNELRQEAQRRFPDPYDRRHHKIANDDWEVVQ